MINKLFSILLALTLMFATISTASALNTKYLTPVKAPIFEAWFISVGIGDAILLKSRDETMLIDGGKRSRANQLKAFMMEHDISHLTAIFNTHWHDDHTTGMISLLKSGVTANKFYTQYKHEKVPKEYLALLPLLDSADTDYITVAGGYEFAIGHAKLKVYQEPDLRFDANARSLVLKVMIGERTMLLTADIGVENQKHLVDMYGSDLTAEVLKYPHHGYMPAAKELLNTVNPQVAIVTNQPRSIPKVVSQLTYRGIDAYYTCFHTIYVATDGKTWYVERELSNK